MNLEELFVGFVAVTLGALAAAAAVSNLDWCYRLHKIRWIEARWGRAGARIFYALLGAALIGLGVAIALGFGPNKSVRGDTSSRPPRPGRLHGLIHHGGVPLW
jgi:hypothetical protein